MTTIIALTTLLLADPPVPIPQTTDGVGQALAQRATPYELPRVYQRHFNGAQSHAESAWYNVSADKPREKFGNANREFPWNVTAGIDDASDTAVSHYVAWPGTHRPEYRTLATQCLTWDFPIGTTFAEVLHFRSRRIAFELRLLNKTRRGWVPEVYVPYPCEEDYIAAARSLGVEPVITDGPHITLRDSQPDRRVISLRGQARVLAPLPPQIIDDLLRVPFRPVTVHGHWGGLDDESRRVPITTADYHIIPRGYIGRIVLPRRDECLACHSTTMAEARSFDARREWYGRVRGSDSIFSWHPFAADSISHDGFWRPRRLRADAMGVPLEFGIRGRG